jgi:hypothetical protein
MRWTECLEPECLESVVSAFQAEDVDTVELLVTLFGVQTQYTALKTAVQDFARNALENVHRVHPPNARPIPTEEGLN